MSIPNGKIFCTLRRKAFELAGPEVQSDLAVDGCGLYTPPISKCACLNVLVTSQFLSFVNMLSFLLFILFNLRKSYIDFDDDDDDDIDDSYYYYYYSLLLL